MFTRRHYEAVAELVGVGMRQATDNNRQPIDPAELLAEIGRDFGRMFARDNSRFDWTRYQDRIEEFATGKRR